jgi:hypothetical protein
MAWIATSPALVVSVSSLCACAAPIESTVAATAAAILLDID